MRVIKINARDGRVFYGQMVPAEVFANPSHVGIILDEKILVTRAPGEAETKRDQFTFNPKSGAVVIGSGSQGESECDLFMVDTFDMPRLDEYATLRGCYAE